MTKRKRLRISISTAYLYQTSYNKNKSYLLIFNFVKRGRKAFTPLKETLEFLRQLI